MYMTIEMTKTTISEIENRKKEGSIKTLKKLALKRLKNGALWGTGKVI